MRGETVISKWECQIITLRDLQEAQAVIHREGLLGWELISLTQNHPGYGYPYMAILKRQKS